MVSLMCGFTSNRVWLWTVKWLLVNLVVNGISLASAAYLNIESVPARRVEPYHFAALGPFTTFNLRAPRDDSVPPRDVMYIRPSDAVSRKKWSQPAVELPHSSYLDRHGKDDAPSHLKDDYHISSSYSPPSENYDIQTSSTKTPFEEHFGSHLLKSVQNSYSVDPSTETPESEKFAEQSVLSKPKLHLSRNNFTESNDSHDLGPSNSVFDYQSSVMLKDEPSDQTTIAEGVISAGSTELVDLSYLLNTTPSPVHERDALEKDSDLRKWISWTAPGHFRTTVSYDFSSTKSFLDNVDVSTSSVSTVDNTGEEFPDALPPVASTTGIRLGSGAVAGIVIAVLVCVTVITSSVIYLLYRRYNGKCTNVVEGKFNSDNCGYLDDSLRSSVYLNNHIELPKENSEEMSSLDNDSFLNSLETMTIQNYWADNTKNTKV